MVLSYRKENLSKGGFFMKSTGVVRPIDTLGRFVLPKEIRDNMKKFKSAYKLIKKAYLDE